MNMLFACLLAVTLVFCVYGSPLNHGQQTSIRRILANPNTPLWIRTRTKNIVYEKYHYWAQNISKEYLKKRSYAELKPELEQCVSVGLLAAIDRYDWSRPTSFPAYAKKYVLGSVMSGIETLYRTRNEIDFVSPKQQWIMEKGAVDKDSASAPLVSKADILGLLNPEEQRLFEHMYGHVFDMEHPKKSVADICDLMAYGNRETMRIKKTRMFQKIRDAGTKFQR
jgi:hypothetical protein